MVPGKRWFGLAMASAIGMPIAFSSTDGIGTWFNDGSAHPATQAQLVDGKPAAPPGSEAEVHAREVSQALNGRIDTPPIPEALRFDATRDWLFARFKRVSTCLASEELQGYRVALVTGSQRTDLAGSLTYYFDASQKLQRITFRGVTGDPAELVAWLTSRYGFQRVLANQPRLQLYRVKKFSKATGELQISPAEVVRADAPNSRFQVALEMNNPD